jgi:hypothetical protein
MKRGPTSMQEHQIGRPCRAVVCVERVRVPKKERSKISALADWRKLGRREPAVHLRRVRTRLPPCGRGRKVPRLRWPFLRNAHTRSVLVVAPGTDLSRMRFTPTAGGSTHGAPLRKLTSLDA